jgi:hypothetical protein
MCCRKGGTPPEAMPNDKRKEKKDKEKEKDEGIPLKMMKRVQEDEPVDTLD